MGICDLACTVGRYLMILKMMRLVFLLSLGAFLALGNVNGTENAREKCPSPGSISSSSCAKIYNLQNCDGEHSYLSEQSTCTDVGSHWDDRISSMVVRTGCTFRGYKSGSCQGEEAICSSDTCKHMMGHGMGDDV